MNELDVYPEDAQITLKKHTVKSLQRPRVPSEHPAEESHLNGLHASSAHPKTCARTQSINRKHDNM